MEKISFIYLKDFLDFIYTEFFFFIFFLTNASLACRLRKAYTVLWAANSFVGSEAPNHNDFEQFWKFEFHFEHFPRNTRFLRFDGSINHLFLVKNHQQKFRDQENVRHPTSNLLKWDLIKTLITFQKPYLRIIPFLMAIRNFYFKHTASLGKQQLDYFTSIRKYWWDIC